MMKIGTRPNYYMDRYGVQKGLEKMRSDGYECADAQEFIRTDTPLFQLSEADFDREVFLRGRMYKDAGIEVFQVHGPWRWPSQDGTAEERNERFYKMAKSVRGAALMDCHNFVIHPIMPFGVEENPYTREMWEMNLEFMSHLTEVGRQNNVVICLENLPMLHFKLARPEETLAFVKEINSPWLRVCLDTGHAAVFGISPADSVRLLGKEYLQVLHVHDNDGIKDRHWLPETGVIDWPDFTRALLEIGYEGCFSLETALADDIPEEERDQRERDLCRCAFRLAGR